MIILRFRNFVVPISHILVAIEVTVYEFTNNINSINLFGSCGHLNKNGLNRSIGSGTTRSGALLE